MQSKQITFSKLRIVRKSDKTPEQYTCPSKENFGNIPQDPEIDLKTSDGYKMRAENTDEYFWLTVEYNTLNPRRNQLYNVKTKEERPNNRTRDEIEPNKQRFFLYHHSSGILYQTSEKEKILKHCLEKYNKGETYYFESIFENKDEFIEHLKKVKEISFVDGSGLLGDLRKHLNILTDSCPDVLKISLQYKDRDKSFFKNLFPHLFKDEEKHKIDNLLIKGIDEDSFSVVFNKQTFIQKTSIQPKITDEGVWDAEDVKRHLLETIKGETQ